MLLLPFREIDCRVSVNPVLCIVIYALCEMGTSVHWSLQGKIVEHFVHSYDRRVYFIFFFYFCVQVSSLSLSFHSPKIKMLIRRHYLHCLSAFKRTSELKKANSRSSFLVTKRKTTDLVFDAVSPLFSWGNKTDEKKVLAFDMKATLLSCSFWCILCFAERLIYYYCHCYDISNRSAWLDGFTWLFQFIYAPRMQSRFQGFAGARNLFTTLMNRPHYQFDVVCGYAL